jgi:hypothetical protein
MKSIHEQYTGLESRVEKLEEDLDAAKTELEKFIAQRFNEVYPLMSQFDPEKYPPRNDPFMLDDRHRICVTIREDRAIFELSDYFRGEWDSDDVTVPSALFFGDKMATDVFAELARKAEEERTALDKKRKQESERQERKQYERLKAKFG